jgi:N-acyl-D-amino-acid deacylase
VFAQERRWIERGGLKQSWQSFRDFFTLIEDQGSAINLCCLVGHGTIRKRIMSLDNRPPSAEELAAMERLTAEAFNDGAVGLSTGLEYLPGGYAGLDEICALARIARDAGGFYASHMRNEGDTLREAVEEALAVGRQTGIAVQISHHKAEGRRNWGKVKQTLPMMDEARRSGIDVLTDQYPYTAFMTGLSVIILPAWANAGTPEQVTARLREPASRDRIRSEILADPPVWDQVFVGVARNRHEDEGRSLADLGKREGKDPVDSALDLMIDENGIVSCAYFALCEEDVEAILRDPHTMIGSDGVTATPSGVLGEDKTHPRSYGTFPKVLSVYVRDKHAVPLGEAIRRMTSLPASRIGLRDRGRLAVGAKADIVVFDAAGIADNADFAHPHRFASGIVHVFVNGRHALAGGEQSDVLAGRVLRRADIDRAA